MFSRICHRIERLFKPFVNILIVYKALHHEYSLHLPGIHTLSMY